jgi:hypothetical protein
MLQSFIVAVFVKNKKNWKNNVGRKCEKYKLAKPSPNRVNSNQLLA